MTEQEFINSLFYEFVGFLKYSPQSFFVLEPFEAIEIISKAKTRFKFEHELMYISVRNAIGSMFSKGYKYQDVFKENEAKKEVTEEEKQQMKEFLENW